MSSNFVFFSFLPLSFYSAGKSQMWEFSGCCVLWALLRLSSVLSADIKLFFSVNNDTISSGVSEFLSAGLIREKQCSLGNRAARARGQGLVEKKNRSKRKRRRNSREQIHFQGRLIGGWMLWIYAHVLVPGVSARLGYVVYYICCLNHSERRLSSVLFTLRLNSDS